MADKILISLVILIAILYTGHAADHVVRGDIPLGLTPESLVSLAINIGIYAFIGVGLYLYIRGKVGPRLWAIAAGVGVVLGWLGHFSPFTDQPPQYILAAYDSAAAGALALGCLTALMLALVAV